MFPGQFVFSQQPPLMHALLKTIDQYCISQADRDEIEHLLCLCKHERPMVDDIWRMMDAVWTRMHCDERKPDVERLKCFYEHPVWLLNSIFIEQDEVSLGHRNAIATWVNNHRNAIELVLDYGGGFGTLGRLIAEKVPDVRAMIYDPCAAKYAKAVVNVYPGVMYTDDLVRHLGRIDCLMAIDVLEHVINPLKCLHDMITLVRHGGYLIIGNNFYPVIKCHLPQNFHFRYTFDLFAGMMGLDKIGKCPGSHAIIFRKGKKNASWRKIRKVENISKSVGSLLIPVETGAGIIIRAIRRRGSGEYFN